MKLFQIVFLFLISLSVLAGEDVALEAPEGAEVYFIRPQLGDVVIGPVHIVMGLRGMGVAPAGVQIENTGHHHLLIDAPPAKPGVAIGKDDRHRHFGGGQTEAMVELSPGQHTLQLVVGDFAHRPHAEPIVSEVITITVK